MTCCPVKTVVNLPTVSNGKKQKIFKKNLFFESYWWKEQDSDPDPEFSERIQGFGSVNVTDPEHSRNCAQ